PAGAAAAVSGVGPVGAALAAVCRPARPAGADLQRPARGRRGRDRAGAPGRLDRGAGRRRAPAARPRAAPRGGARRMTALADALALYRRLVAASLRSQLQYRAAMVMNSLGAALITSSEFVALWALFDRFGQVRGWQLREVALFYGLISVTYALTDAMSRGFDR